MSRPSSRNSLHLEPPRKSVELQDPGASGLESSEGEEYFSDASEGRRRLSRPQTPSSPIPTTRVERVDDKPSHGQVPGTDAYNKRRQDAVPDEVELIPEGSRSKRNSSQFLEAPISPGGSNIPRTVVEKIDPDSPSYGDIPGTEAYQKRLADATPDVVLKNPDPSKGSRYSNDFEHHRTSSGNLIPETIVTRVDDEPAYGEVEGTRAKEMRRQDASPDKFEVEDAVIGSPTLDRSMSEGSTPRLLSQPDQRNDEHAHKDDENFGDDFDDFEEGAQAGVDDDFGDFDDGFQEPEDETAPHTTYTNSQPEISFPLIDAASLSSLSDLMVATQVHLDAMFPTTTVEQRSSLPAPESIPADSPVFPSDRSRSLWKQLITPPPLQPPNWTQSRIRRLFLISLGVPVDLDEILPPSKQKKLILPDINLEPSGKSQSLENKDSIARLKQTSKNDSTASLASSTQSTSRPTTRTKRSASKLPPNPPPLDLLAVKRLCTTTDEKLDGFADDELDLHVKELGDMMEKTKEVLEYWLKRRDGLRKEKEAFEGVIENLVRHARRVRK